MIVGFWTPLAVMGVAVAVCKAVNNVVQAMQVRQ